MGVKNLKFWKTKVKDHALRLFSSQILYQLLIISFSFCKLRKFLIGKPIKLCFIKFLHKLLIGQIASVCKKCGILNLDNFAFNCRIWIILVSLFLPDKGVIDIDTQLTVVISKHNKVVFFRLQLLWNRNPVSSFLFYENSTIPTLPTYQIITFCMITFLRYDQLYI